MPVVFRNILIGLFILLIQWLVLGRLQIFGTYPDLVLLYIAWIGLRFGRRSGSAMGFLLGFIMDFIYGTWGIQMFVKTLLGFLVGLFPADEREQLIIQPQQALVVGFFVALLHNGMLAILLILSTGIRSPGFAFTLWIGSSIYTAMVSGLVSRFVG